MFDLCTVDVWDTILRRRCHPDAVKLHTAKVFLLQHEPVIRPAFRAEISLLRLRVNIEHEFARRSRLLGGDGEYRLHEVLSEWIKQVSSYSSDQYTRLVPALVDGEWEQECLVSYVDDRIIAELARYPALKTIFLSDFYMSCEALYRLLEAKGVGALFSGGHSSCDYDLNKSSGRLFTKVQEIYGIEPRRHCHIGDNPLSDFKVPRRLGIHSVLYSNKSKENFRHKQTVAFHNRRLLIQQVEARCRSARSHVSNEPQSEAFNYGLELSPLFAGFALFIFESACRDQPDRLFFFTREGEFFAKLYCILCNARQWPRKTPPRAEVLEVSRLSTFAASLQEASIIEMKRLWSGFPNQSIKALACSIGMEEKILASTCSRLGIDFDEPIQKPESNESIVQLFDDPEFKDLLFQAIILQQKNLMLYLHAKEFQLARKVGVVDIGWRGSIQDNLALVMPEVRFSGYYLGLQKFQNAQPDSCDKSAFGPNLNLSPSYSGLFGNLPLLEVLANSSGGSVIGYGSGIDGSVKAMRVVDENEEQAFGEGIAKFQEGVCRGMEIWAEHIHVHALSSAELRTHAMHLWADLVHTPPEFLARVLSQVKHNEMFGRGLFSSHRIPRRRSLRSIFRKPF